MVDRTNRISPAAGAADTQGKPFPECSKHTREEYEKDAKEKLGLMTCIAFSKCRDWHRSEDFAMDAIEKIANAGHPLCEVTFKYCLLTLSSVMMDFWRKKHDLVAVDEAPSDDTPIFEAKPPPWLASLTTATEEALNTLPKRQRQVIIARYIDEKSVEEVCKELELTAPTVHNYTTLGLKRLRPLLES